MNEKEYLNKIIEHKGNCNEANLECQDCPFFDKCNRTFYIPEIDRLMMAENKLKE